MRRLVAVALLAPLVVVAPLPASTQSAGVVFEVEVTDHAPTRPPEVMTLSVSGTNLKIQPPRDTQQGPGEMIFRGDRKEMIAIDHDRKSYIVMDEAMIQQIAGQMGEAMKQMEAALANVPPEQRAMVEQMMRGRGMMPGAAPVVPTPELRPTGERATHNGYDTVKYDLLLDGKKQSEIFVTDWSNISEYASVRPAFEAMAAFMKDLIAAIAQSPLGNMANLNTGGFERMADMNGFPVYSREFDDSGQLTSETALRGAKSASFDADAFEAPAGYSRQQLPGGGGDR